MSWFRPGSSRRVVDVEELRVETRECGPEARGEGARAERLGAVMAARGDVDPVFARGGLRILAGLAGDEEIAVEAAGVLGQARCAAGDDADLGDRRRAAVEEEQALGDTRAQERVGVGDADGRVPGAGAAGRDAARGEGGLELRQADGARELGGVPQLGVPVERQVIGGERDAGAE